MQGVAEFSVELGGGDLRVDHFGLVGLGRRTLRDRSRNAPGFQKLEKIALEPLTFARGGEDAGDPDFPARGTLGDAKSPTGPGGSRRGDDGEADENSRESRANGDASFHGPRVSLPHAAAQGWRGREQNKNFLLTSYAVNGIVDYDEMGASGKTAGPETLSERFLSSLKSTASYPRDARIGATAMACLPCELTETRPR